MSHFTQSRGLYITALQSYINFLEQLDDCNKIFGQTHGSFI